MKKTIGSGIKNENMSDQQLPELHKQIIRKFEKRKVHSPVIDNILADDLADRQLISKFNKVICFLLCVIVTFSKYNNTYRSTIKMKPADVKLSTCVNPRK